MIALDRRSRAAVATAALTVFTAAVVMTVNGGADTGAASADAVPAPVSPPAAGSVALTAPRRDPFAGGVLPAKTNATPALPPLPPIPAAIGALPPNLPVAGVRPRVTAIVTGTRPSALVEEGDTVRLLAPGDALDGDRVASIDDAGVHLARGGTLRVTPAGAPAPPLPLPVPPVASGGRP